MVLYHFQRAFRYVVCVIRVPIWSLIPNLMHALVGKVMFDLSMVMIFVFAIYAQLINNMTSLWDVFVLIIHIL